MKELIDYQGNTIHKYLVRLENFDNLLADEEFNLMSSDITIEFDNLNDQPFELQLRNGQGEYLSLTLKPKENLLLLDRSQSGLTDFSEHFGARASGGKMHDIGNSVELRLLIDHMSVELFLDNGLTVMTEIIFPTSPFEIIGLSTENKNLEIKNITARQIKL